MVPDFVFRPMSAGHGAGFIRRFVDALLGQGIPRAVTDPVPDNARAVRVYARAGFRSERLIDMPDGPALLMVRDP